MKRISRRRALAALFCSSALLGMNVQPRPASAAVSTSGRHFLAIGDFGSGNDNQRAVAAAMQAYAKAQSITPDALLLLGDNFYGKSEGGVGSKRWDTGFESLYPTSAFPGPCYAILGNHDYHDNLGGERTQLAYARKTDGTRWTMPAKWYAVDIASPYRNAYRPLIRFLMLDSNLPAVSGGRTAAGQKRPALTEKEASEQTEWLRQELATRGTFTIVCGHHPLYSNGRHGDSPRLIEAWGDLLEEHGVHVYLCGHDHDLQHLELEGRRTSFVVSGGGGARTRTLKEGRPSKFGKDVYGFTHLQCDGDRLTIRHIDVTGQQLHAFTKHADGRVEIAG